MVTERPAVSGPRWRVRPQSRRGCEAAEGHPEGGRLPELRAGARGALSGSEHPLRAAFRANGQHRSEARRGVGSAMVRRRPRGRHSTGAWHVGQSQWQARGDRAEDGKVKPHRCPCQSRPCRSCAPSGSSKLRSDSEPALGGTRRVMCSPPPLVSRTSHVTRCGLSRRPPSVPACRSRSGFTRCATPRPR